MPEILHRLTLPADPAEVYEQLTTSEGLSGWWTTDAKAQAKVGSKAVFGFCESRRLEMEIVALEPDAKVVWKCIGGDPEWLDTTITFSLKRTPDRTELTLAHTGWKSTDGHLAECSFQWALYLQSLQSFLGTGIGHPHKADEFGVAALASWESS